MSIYDITDDKVYSYTVELMQKISTYIENRTLSADQVRYIYQMLIDEINQLESEDSFGSEEFDRDNYFP